jgi:endonuclease/exonuclease/phosphatase family metal-dependent hydrolase
MKALLLIFLAGSLFFISCKPGIQKTEEPASVNDIQVMTFNIRYGLANDGEDSWEFRKEMVMEVIQTHAPDLLGLQEALKFQLDAICERFPEYEKVGIGRDPGGEGEYAAILYRKERYEAQESGTFWLSNTPEVPSTHWGNKHLRICTWVRLIERSTGQALYFYNTHYDHQSQPARENSSILLAKRINERSNPDPVILTGDFNADEENSAIGYLRAEISTIGQGLIRLRDSFRIMHPGESNVGTFNAFTGENTRGKIDYVFVSSAIKVLEAEIIKFNKDGRYPSDHYPVSARLDLGSNP